jgi:hypothetical protein
MRGALAATLAVAAGLFVANMLGVAAAEAPTSTTPTTTITMPARTVSVEGVAHVAIAQEATVEAADAAYHQGMETAVADGHSKAELLVDKAGATLGSVQSITEDGGSIECRTKNEEGESEVFGYAPYKGEPPDSSTESGRFVAAPLAAAKAPRTSKTPTVRRKRNHATAKKASSSVVCELTARVSLVYTIA